MIPVLQCVEAIEKLLNKRKELSYVKKIYFD